MTEKREIERLHTGVPNLDDILGGGVPKGSLVIVSGPPGSGKTIFTQQLCFENVSEKSRVLYFSTLSEPTAKTLRYLERFTFFDPKRVDRSLEFVDLGVILRTNGLEQTAALLMDHVKRVKPAIVVIDSFKVFDDLAVSKDELRKFGYQLAVSLMAWEVTTLLLGEYAPNDYESNPIFSVADGLIVLSQRETAGEHLRYLRAIKMRGTDHSRDEHAFAITPNGLEMFAPRVNIHRGVAAGGELERLKTGIKKLDELIGPGIPLGSTLLVSGVAGTGKTVLLLEFLYRGALAGEKGIFFSFEETEARLLSTAKGLGWDLAKLKKEGLIEIVFIPQPEIAVERHIFMFRERIQAMKAQRVVLDSVSVFLHKISDAQASRERVFHLCTIVQNAQAVALFATDIPYGSQQISRRGVEETVVDGVIILTSTEEALERQRYLEIYKLRNTPHLKGRHDMTIGPDGIAVFPRYGDDLNPTEAPPARKTVVRLPSGIKGLDDLMGGGLLEQSVTLVSGAAGIGKTTLAMQFVLQGATKRAPGLFVTLKEGPAQLAAAAKTAGIPFGPAMEKGSVEVLYLAREHTRPGQFLSILDDKIKALGTRRLVLDAATHMMTERMPADQLRHLLYLLVVRFKKLGVTSLFTLDATTLHTSDSETGRNLSPIADNLLMLRYANHESRLEPMLTVVKTRGSAHDFDLHPVIIGKEGLRVGLSSPIKPKKARRR